MRLVWVLVLLAALAGAAAAGESVSIVLGPTNVEQGLRLVGDAPGGDGLTVAGREAGRDCRRNAPRERGGMMLYFQVDDAFLPPGSHDCWVRVEYLDRGEDEWLLEYDANDDSVLKVPTMPGVFKTAGVVEKTDTGEWRHADLHLPDARFAGRCNGGDFRLSVGNPEDGEECFSRVTVYRAQPADYRPPQEVTMQRVRAGRGMEVIFGASNFPPRATAQEVRSFYSNVRVEWFRPLGVTSWESYVRWSALEPEPGQWDFSVYDAEVAVLREKGLCWVPFFILGPSYATPDWFKRGPQAVFARCLEHGTDSAVQSIWNPALPAQVDRVLAAFAARYRDQGVIESVLLGISGDFGEAIYPVSGGGWTGDYHQHGGYWCGDPYALASFRRYLAGKYPDAAALNRAWGTQSPDIGAAGYPPIGEHGGPGEALNMRLPAHRRQWLDFVEWYRASMTEWAGFWMATARKHFPQAKVYLCTGGDGHPTHGSDFTGQCRVAAAAQGGVRITNEGSDYTANLMLTRWVGTASKHYGGYFNYEPASGVDAGGLAARIYNVAASGAAGLFEYSGNVTASAARRRSFRANLPQLTRGTPQVQVAFFVPTTWLALHPDQYWSGFFDRPRLFRDRFDFDLVDEGLVLDGALERYRVLVAVGGDVIPAEVARKLAAWVKAGGVLVSADLGRVVTVAGRLVTDWPHQATGKDLADCASPLGEGRLLFYPGSYQEPEFAELLSQVVYHRQRLGPRLRGALEADAGADGVFTTVRTRDVLLYNGTGQPVKVAAPALRSPVEVPSHGVLSVPRGRPK